MYVKGTISRPYRLPLVLSTSDVRGSAPAAMSSALAKALGDKKGIRRYGHFTLPMDDALALCAVDLGGRPYLNFDCHFPMDRVGELDTELVKEFFYAVSYSAGINLHIKMLAGDNTHHMIEAIFKAFAMACPSTMPVSSTV